MDRADLLSANAKIFAGQGHALNQFAKRSVKVVVVGNPANTNALITSINAPDIPPENITALTRLDQSRAGTAHSRVALAPLIVRSTSCTGGGQNLYSSGRHLQCRRVGQSLQDAISRCEPRRRACEWTNSAPLVLSWRIRIDD